MSEPATESLHPAVRLAEVRVELPLRDAEKRPPRRAKPPRPPADEEDSAQDEANSHQLDRFA